MTVVASVDAALDQVPAGGTAGVLVGWDSWRLVVELLLPQYNAALVGTARVGTSRVAGKEWVDVTPNVHGLEFTQGADQVLGRCRVGVCNLTLESPGGKWSNSFPVSSSYGRVGTHFGPGAMVRVSLRNSTLGAVAGLWTAGNATIPLFCGIVETWLDDEFALGKYQRVSITAVETTASLAAVNPTNVTTLLSGFPNPILTWAQVIDHMLSTASWRFGPWRNRTTWPTTFAPGSGVEWLKNFTPSDNGAAVLAHVADSLFASIRSDRDGRLCVDRRIDDFVNTAFNWPIWPRSAAADALRVWALGQARIDISSIANGGAVCAADSVRVRKDTEALINACSVSSTTNGNTQTGTERDAASVSRFGEQSFFRNDLSTVTHPTVLFGGTVSLEYARQLIARARLDRVLEPLELNAAHGPATVRAMATLTYADDVRVTHRHTKRGPGFVADCRVRQISHRIQMTGRSAPIWTAALTADLVPNGYSPMEAIP